MGVRRAPRTYGVEHPVWTGGFFVTSVLPVASTLIFPVISFTVGRDISDHVPPIDAAPQYFDSPGIDQDLFPASTVISPYKGQWLADDVLPIESAPYFYKQPTPFVAAANPVIPPFKGQWLGDEIPDIDSRPVYFAQPGRDPDVFPASPVIPLFKGQWLGDAVPPIESAPQFYIQPIESAVIAPANPVVPFYIGQWLGDDVPPIESAPRYIQFQQLQDANPVVPPFKGQWLGDIVPVVDIEPRYFAQPSLPAPAANLVIDFTIGQWLGDVLPGVDTAPRYFVQPSQNLVVITFQDYECIREIHQSMVSSTTTYSFFAVLRRVGAQDARARLFSITDGTAVAGSEVQTSSTSFVIVESGTITLTGDKEYKTQAGFVAGSEIRILGAGFEGNPA